MQIQLEDVGILEEVLVNWFLLLPSIILEEWVLETAATTASTTAESPTTHVEVELLSAAATSATSAEGITPATEELTEQVVHVHVWATAASLLVPDSFFAAHVISPALVRIRQGLIRQSYFLELLLCSLWIVLILIRVVFDGQFLELLLNLCFVCISRHVQYLVVVLLWLLLLTRASAPATGSKVASAAATATEAAELRGHEERWAAPQGQRWIE